MTHFAITVTLSILFYRAYKNAEDNNYEVRAWIYVILSIAFAFAAIGGILDMMGVE